MSAPRQFAWMLAPAVLLCAPGAWPRRRTMRRARQQNTPGQSAPVEKWTVTVGKSLIIDSPLNIERISVANGNLADAVAISPKEVLINGKAPGETSLIVWQKGGSRLVYDLTVRPSPAKLEAVRAATRARVPGRRNQRHLRQRHRFLSAAW